MDIPAWQSLVFVTSDLLRVDLDDTSGWPLYAFLNSSTVQEKFKELQAFLSTSISLEVQGVSGPILER